MNGLLRFSDYDLFSYVASGFAALLVWDLTASTHYVLDAQWTVAEGFLTLAAAYILGHLLAAPSGFILERQLVKHVLLKPTAILMGTEEIGWRRILQATILRDYYTPFEPGLRQRVRERANLGSDDQPSGEVIFWHAFPVAKKDATAYVRMESFLRLYGFCRNISFVGIAGSLLLGCDAVIHWSNDGWSGDVVEGLEWAAVALLVGIGMLHRYLKFHRLYAVEVLVTFSEQPTTSSAPS